MSIMYDKNMYLSPFRPIKLESSHGIDKIAVTQIAFAGAGAILFIL